MATHRVSPALAVASALVLGGCGADGDATPDTAAIATVTANATGVAPPSARATKAGSAKAGTVKNGTPGKQPAPVAPDVVVPTSTDAVSRPAQGGWQGVTLANLKRLDARLVVDQQATITRVREACNAFSIGMFQADAVALVRKKFSASTLKLTQDQAEMVYQVILRDACYVMSDQDGA